jgi:hypothetical protein
MSPRSALADRLHLEPTAPTKTFVLDVHTGGSSDADLLRDVAGSDTRVEATDDSFLFRVPLDDGEMWVDQLDPRFWAFHTDLPRATAQRWLRERVEARRDLDWMWLPSEHLRDPWPGARSVRVSADFAGQDFLGEEAPASRLRLRAVGAESDQLLDFISSNDRYRSAVSLGGIELALDDGDNGHLREAVTRRGAFAASGDSLELHLQFVRRIVTRYSHLVTLLEHRALWFERLDSGGGTISGEPVLVEFSRPVPDMQRFVDELLAVRQPFRLWGIPRIDGDVAEVDAVDLHVGQRLRLDVGPTWMRVYLERGACGNTVARLLSNLQQRFDSALRLVDPALQEAFAAGGHPPSR